MQLSDFTHTQLPASLAESLTKCRLDHVAVAVRDLAPAVAFFELLGLRFESAWETVESEKVIVAFAAVDQIGHLELVAPTHESSAVHRYLEKKGPGLHHLCFLVDDLKTLETKLRSQGILFINEQPKVGAHQRLINFIHPKSAQGVLIELSQRLTQERPTDE